MSELRDLADNFNTDLLFFGLYALTVVLLDLVINVTVLNDFSEVALLSKDLGCF